MHRDKTSHVRITQHFLSPLPAMQPQLTKKSTFTLAVPRGNALRPCSATRISQVRKGRWWDEAEETPRQPQGELSRDRGGPWCRSTGEQWALAAPSPHMSLFSRDRCQVSTAPHVGVQASLRHGPLPTGDLWAGCISSTT